MATGIVNLLFLYLYMRRSQDKHYVAGERTEEQQREPSFPSTMLACILVQSLTKVYFLHSCLFLFVFVILNQDRSFLLVEMNELPCFPLANLFSLFFLFFKDLGNTFFKKSNPDGQIVKQSISLYETSRMKQWTSNRMIDGIQVRFLVFKKKNIRLHISSLCSYSILFFVGLRRY